MIYTHKGYSMFTILYVSTYELKHSNESLINYDEHKWKEIKVFPSNT